MICFTGFLFYPAVRGTWCQSCGALGATLSVFATRFGRWSMCHPCLVHLVAKRRPPNARVLLPFQMEIPTS